MTEDQNPRFRVLIPSRPEDELRGVACLLAETLPPERADVRRLYIHRPGGSDLFIPDADAHFSENTGPGSEAENATGVSAARTMSALVSKGFEVSAEVIDGTPTEEIVREANSWPADLVVVPTRSLSAGDNHIGGIPSALLSHAACPVLTHSAIPSEYRVRRILIPTDFSADSRKSIEWGLALARITGADPVLLHVVRSGRWPGIDPLEVFANAARELERCRFQAIPDLRRPVVKARVLEAPTPAEGILSFAKDESADLVVMSATGNSLVRAVLLGANTRKVVRRSACPVLVIPTANRVSVQSFLGKAGTERSRGALETLLSGALR